MSGDPKVAGDLFEACKDLGFFLLDLSGGALGEEIIAEVDAMFDLSTANFNQSEEIKQAFPIVVGKNPLGYAYVALFTYCFLAHAFLALKNRV